MMWSYLTFATLTQTLADELRESPQLLSRANLQIALIHCVMGALPLGTAAAFDSTVPAA